MSILVVRLAGLEPLSNVIAYELSDFLSERGGFAFPREQDIVLDLSNVAGNALSLPALIGELKNILNRLGMEGSYVVELGKDEVTVRVTSRDAVEKIVEKLRGASVRVETCPHCGFTTPYPEVMREHIKIHYLL